MSHCRKSPYGARSARVIAFSAKPSADLSSLPAKMTCDRAAVAARRTPFRERCEALLTEHCPEAVGLPRDIADLSNVNTCSFDAFCDRIAAARVVFTTRLHAGLYAAMLGRRTFIFDGAYHKIRGIHELSLKDRANVTFVEQ